MNVAPRPERQSLDLISLCTGGAGLDLGVELAVPGARSVCLVEREAFAVGHLVAAMRAGLLADAPVWSDATTFDGRAWRGCVDGVIGGIPCQPHSLAGKRLGAADERDLWSHARRIIVQSGAWFVLIENVRGMLSSGGAERVWRDLGRLGFACELGLFSASEVGASHERQRCFILGVANGDGKHGDRAGVERPGWGRQSADGCRELANARGDGQQRGAQPDIEPIQNGQRASRRGDAQRCDHPLEHAKGERWGERRPEPSIRSGRGAAGSADHAMGDSDAGARQVREGDAIVSRGRAVEPAGDRAASERPSPFPPAPNDLDGWRDALDRAPQLEPAVHRMADGVAGGLGADRVDALRMLGNGVVPLQAAYALRTLATRLADTGAPAAERLVRMMGPS